MLNVSRTRPEPLEWVPAERLGGREVDAVLRPWLIGQGLLTQRLREKFRERFECRAGDPWTGLLSAEERAFLGSSDHAGLVREERLRVDGRDWVLPRMNHPYFPGGCQTSDGACGREWTWLDRTMRV